ncbi:hypothetical protein X750_19835 [Mesorhizobium sp. LNJC394B00]|nr:hypothetical protein X750_19835 [Mesorhizobium sp. LNJC394B00]ESZ75849.1 hypothetical protein X726_15650 [Mesorhizobium sp. L103C105A0]
MKALTDGFNSLTTVAGSTSPTRPARTVIIGMRLRRHTVGCSRS